MLRTGSFRTEEKIAEKRLKLACHKSQAKPHESSDMCDISHNNDQAE